MANRTRNITHRITHAQDTLYAQAALQGQSIFISSADSGSDTADQNTSGHGNVRNQREPLLERLL